MTRYFPNNLKYLRKQLKMSQAAIGELIDKDQSTIANWENGKMDPSLENVILLSEKMNIPLHELVGRDLRIKQKEEKENELESKLKKFAIDHGVELTINKNKELSAEDALKIQSEVNKIVMEELNNNKK